LSFFQFTIEKEDDIQQIKELTRRKYKVHQIKSKFQKSERLSNARDVKTF